MSRTRKTIELWLFLHFDLLVYIGSFLLTLGWIYSAGCRYQYKYEHKKLLATSVNIEAKEYSVSTPHDENNEIQMKFILEWVEPYTLYPFWNEGQSDFFKRSCKINTCFVTSNRNMLRSIADFDAVIFHGPKISFQFIEKPKVRNPSQKYVFLSMESNMKYPICDDRLDGFFNWTWTNRFDSDYTCGHLTIRNKEGNVIGPNKNIHWINVNSMKPIDDALKKKLNSKTKAAAWIVSNCQVLGKSVTLLKKIQLELKRYGLKVDIRYGCNDVISCDPKNISCLQMIQKKYYFYLALENYFSEDYTIEKLLLALQNYAIPVVFGELHNYTRFMPDGIYLDGGKLKPKALAKEMADIINDKERYYSFFKWHNHYSYHARDEAPDTDDHCKMCEMLHDEELMKKTTVYKDFRKWWNSPGSCRLNAGYVQG